MIEYYNFQEWLNENFDNPEWLDDGLVMMLEEAFDAGYDLGTALS